MSILHTASKQSHDIGVLWWWMAGVGGAVFFGAVALLVMAWFGRDKPGMPVFGTRELAAELAVLMFGIAIPLFVLVALFGVSDIYLIRQTSPVPARYTSMTVDVIAHQWWWEVRYPGTDVVTANEIHIPVNAKVNVVATTDDVIHSLWVPALNRKIDTIPGYHNRVTFDANRTGVFRGQCSQYCGFQHAHMALKVFVQRPAAYRSWLANQERPGRTPTTAQERAGENLFMKDQCESCHTIAGTAARGRIGPDLTHLASRTTLAADMIPNTPRELEAWIRDPQAIKPGVRMPDLGLPRAQIVQIVAYLHSLR